MPFAQVIESAVVLSGALKKIIERFRVKMESTPSAMSRKYAAWTGRYRKPRSSIRRDIGGQALMSFIQGAARGLNRYRMQQVGADMGIIG